MKHLLTLTLFLGIAWGQNQTVIKEGTGLEITTINDFNLIVEEYSGDPVYKKIGLTSQYIETKVKLALRSNGIIPDQGSGNKKLYINIKILEDQGYIYSINTEFMRPVQYPINYKSFVFNRFDEFDDVRYKYGVTTYSKAGVGATGYQGALENIMSHLLIYIDDFSIALLEANDK